MLLGTEWCCPIQVFTNQESLSRVILFGFDEREFKLSTATIFVALLVFGFVPLVNLIRYLPLCKEILLGTVVVAAFTSISDTKTGIKFAFLTGMQAAVAFNLVYIPGQFLLGGLLGGLSGAGSTTAAESAGAMAALTALGALTNLFGLVFMSPIGYVLGGAFGSVLNS